MGETNRQSMDEAQRRAALEALQKHHRIEWQKQAGLKPLETEPLPQTLARIAAEEAPDAAASDEQKDYSIPDEAVAAIEQHSFDTHQQPEASGEQPPDVGIADTEPPRLASLEPPEPQAVAIAPSAEPASTPAVAMSSEWQKAVDAKQPEVEQAAKSDSVSPPAVAMSPEWEKAAATEPQPLKDNAYVVRPNSPRTREPDSQETRDKRASVAKGHLADINQARQQMLQSHRQMQQGGNGFSARGFGGALPNINVGADPENLGEAYRSFADSGGAFAAEVAEALAMLTGALNNATMRIRMLERTIDDGAS